MTTYNTGTPIGSTNVKDLYDNAQNLDTATNDTTSRTWKDRLSVTRRTWWGMEQEFLDTLAGIGYVNLGDYQAGLNVTSRNQVFLHDGEMYKAKASLALPYTTSGDWSSEGENFVAVGDAVVRQDLAATGETQGAEMVGFKQRGDGSVARTVNGKLQDTVNLADKGGFDDGVTINDAALAAAKSTVGAGGVIRLQRKNSGVLKVDGPASLLTGVHLDNDPGLQFDVLSSAFNISDTRGISLQRHARLNFPDMKYGYDLLTWPREHLGDKRVWLTGEDADHSEIDAMSLSGWNNEVIDWPSGDTWFPGTVSPNTADPDNEYLGYNSSGLNKWHTAKQVIKAGEEIEFTFGTAGEFHRGAIIEVRGGYYGVYGGGGSASPIFVSKSYGSAGTSFPIGELQVFTTQPQYKPASAVWKIRIYNKNSFSVSINGVEVSRFDTQTDIIQCGPWWMPSASVGAVAISGFTRTRGNVANGLQNNSFQIWGDSLSATILGGWVDFMRVALDGAAGLQIDALSNKSVPGTTSAQILAKMTAEGVGGAVCFICAGTNDIQGGISPQTLVANVRTMVNLVKAANATPIVWIPPLWYTQAEAGAGVGQPSANSANGFIHRTALKRAMAKLFVKVFDVTQITGPIDSKYLSPVSNPFGADTLVRDNIHGTAVLNGRIGLAAARVALGTLFARTQRRRESQPFTISSPTGWVADSTAPPTLFMDDNGICSLQGQVAPGTVDDGTIIFTIPKAYMPVQTARIAACSNGGTCMVSIGADGNVIVYGFGGTANRLFLSGLSWQSRN